MSARVKWPRRGQAQRSWISMCNGSSVPKVEGTEKRKETATSPEKASNPRSSTAVSSLLPSMRIPASTRTRSVEGSRMLWRHASRGAASTLIRSCLEVRCPLKSRWRSARHCNAGRPAAGSFRGLRRLSGPMKEARQTRRCWPQARRAAVSTSVERRSVSTSSCSGAGSRRAPSRASVGSTACHFCREAAERSAGKATERPLRPRSVGGSRAAGGWPSP
mmetsp:Transcript_2558/g.7690  ORF Transcript_2558/g.7690 Transcript_2558/m.7690 type:complete len:219 (-) Transcript_2558:84-740(-)